MRSFQDNVAPVLVTGRPQRKLWLRLPASGGAGARADGMTNGSEPLINAVTDDKPKMLIGLDQKLRPVSQKWLLLLGPGIGGLDHKVFDNCDSVQV